MKVGEKTVGVTHDKTGGDLTGDCMVTHGHVMTCVGRCQLLQRCSTVVCAE